MISVLHMLFRAKKPISICFAILMILVLMLLALKPEKYEARMSFLISNERAEPVVSADPHQDSLEQSGVTEERMNSEAELLGSAELLQKVVKACGLEKEYEGLFGSKGAAAVERATRKLGRDLTITPVRKSSLINVTYSSAHRDESLRVLQTLASLYQQKHTNLRPSGMAATFFTQRSQDFQKQLEQVQKERAAYLKSNGYSIVSQQMQVTLQQMLDIQREQQQAQALASETESRLLQVRAQQKAHGRRILTQEHSSGNEYSVERLNTMLAELENQRTELATKFLPGDRLIAQADQQIKDTKAALARARQIQTNGRVTDVNPVRQSLDMEADRLAQERAGLAGKKKDLESQRKALQAQLDRMELASIEVDRLDREIGQLKDNVDLYHNKAVQASIADGLDEAKISNVVLAMGPMVPALPKPSPINLATGLLFSLFLSLAVGLSIEMHSGKLHGPSAIEAETGIPVLATLEPNPMRTAAT